MRHKKLGLLMAYNMHHVNNIPLKCVSCDSSISNGIIRNGRYYCNDNCYQKKMFFDTMSIAPPTTPTTHTTQLTVFRQTPQHPVSPPAPFPVPVPQRSTSSSGANQPTEKRRYGGTCAHCNRTYECKAYSVDTGDKWYCDMTCRIQSDTAKRMQQMPTVPFPFASNMCTVFPLSVNPRTGKIVF